MSDSRARPNLVVLLSDQLRASALPLYGESQIDTPCIDRLASEGASFTNAISTCPVCTPYRAMMLTGRYPQTTGVFVNFTSTRHDEIGIGDAFSAAGYRTGWVGKWHLHRGAFPSKSEDWIPEGRSRLGFQYWRAYNCHTDYFDGCVNDKDWNCRHWNGYETDGLMEYVTEFLDSVDDEPFCLFVSPHQPHYSPTKMAPDRLLAKVPQELELPPNVAPDDHSFCSREYRTYLAMTLAIDEMVGAIDKELARRGLTEDTIFAFTSDHGSQFGSNVSHMPMKATADENIAWMKRLPYEASIKVPLVLRWPGVFSPESVIDELVSPVDLFPTFCSLCGVPVPRTVEGSDLAAGWRGEAPLRDQEALLLMNFNHPLYSPDWLTSGYEWRGVRTRDYTLARWIDGYRELYSLADDPFELYNLYDDPAMESTKRALEATLDSLMKTRNDGLAPCEDYRPWIDTERRIVRNAWGPLPHPETMPDWSLLR